MQEEKQNERGALCSVMTKEKKGGRLRDRLSLLNGIFSQASHGTMPIPLVYCI